MNVKASIQSASNLIDSLKISSDAELLSLRKEISTESKSRNGLESRIDKSINLLKGQISLLLEKSSSDSSKFNLSDLESEYIKIEVNINESISEKSKWMDNSKKSSKKIIRKIDSLDEKFESQIHILDKKFEMALQDLKESTNERIDKFEHIFEKTLASTNERIDKFEHIFEKTLAKVQDNIERLDRVISLILKNYDLLWKKN